MDGKQFVEEAGSSSPTVNPLAFLLRVLAVSGQTLF
jgi:hypothetical protein